MDDRRATIFLHRAETRLRVENGSLAIERDGEGTIALPAHQVGEIVCIGAVGVTGALVGLAAENGIRVSFLSESGEYRARLEFSRDVGDPDAGAELAVSAAFESLQGQWEASACDASRLAFARSFVRGKLSNARGVLVRRRREGHREGDASALGEAIDAHDRALASLDAAQDIDALRGHEGAAARAYFATLPCALGPGVREEFPFHGRSRRPPADPFNALLSFLYALLLKDCHHAVLGAGLEPRIGFLHEPRANRPSLACDLAEELRPVLADRLALAVLNLRQIRARDFTPLPDSGGFRMRSDALQRLLSARESRLREPIGHPQAPVTGASVRDLPRLQARALAQALRKRTPESYIPYTPEL